MTEQEKALIEELCDSEAGLINSMYQRGPDAGGLAYQSAVASFADFLRQSEGPFVPGMNLKYRHFVVQLLQRIEEPYRDLVMVETFLGHGGSR